MDNIPIGQCPHCRAEGKSAFTKGKLILASPDGREHEAEIEVITCLSCSYIMMFSREIVEKASKQTQG